MQRKFSWQNISLGIVGVGITGLLGCPQLVAGNSAPASDPEAVTVIQANAPETAIADFTPRTVAFEVCGEIPDWQRPTLADQTRTLTQNPRYGSALEEEPLKSLFDKFWQESIITFTTYGLSARTEPIELSGIGTGIDAMEACYGGDRPEAINQGTLGEVWLMGHRMVAMTWTGTEYLVTVENTDAGLQFVQFERFEAATSLPLIVVASDGREVAVASGDW
ncbi:MAG TPA: hypothetical protein V6D02_06680 [Candidatus Obscuribacterales bacterium]